MLVNEKHQFIIPAVIFMVAVGIVGWFLATRAQTPTAWLRASPDPSLQVPGNAQIGDPINNTGGILQTRGDAILNTSNALTGLIVQNGDVNLGPGNTTVGGSIQVGSHIFIDEPLISADFTFVCSDQAQWTNTSYCGWRYLDSNSVNHYVSGSYGSGRPDRCGVPFTQPASGPSAANMQTIIDSMSPAVTSSGLVFNKNFVSSVSGINSWTGINYCGGGGTDGTTGTVTVNFYQPYIDIR